ncbi:MAG: ribonuclease III [Epulopiscium sp.]|nr:ribonuclease III [Candidatus Epulonipiscium sp.]
MNKENKYSKIESFEKKIHYSFQNKKLLKQALTHSSFANENKKYHLGHNERLEFLGDAILELIVSDYLYKEYTTLKEGDLTKLRASIVCEPSLAEAARRIDIGSYLYLGKGEELTGGRERDSILCDAFEAIIGAVYVDSSIEKVQKYIYYHLLQYVKSEHDHHPFIDYKTSLQEWIQKSSTIPIEYEILEEAGPDHNKRFLVQVRHQNQILGFGRGRSKKEAEQKAAWEAMKNI